MVKSTPVHKVEPQITTGALIVLLVAANVVVLFALLPLPWLQKFALLASPFCPQRPAHSIFVGGQQMPIEARMFGMFGGALLALIYFAARGRLGAAAMPRGWRLGLCVALFGVMALDGTQALLYDMGILRLYTPNLYLRLGTGLASGVGIAMVLVPLTNQALWQHPRTELPLFSGWNDVTGMALVQAALFGVTLSNLPPLLMPLSLVNTLGILAILSTLMTLVLALATHRAGRFTTWKATVGYFGSGFLLTALFIMALAVACLAVFGPGPLS